jgi:hypothetical protein
MNVELVNLGLMDVGLMDVRLDVGDGPTTRPVTACSRADP